MALIRKVRGHVPSIGENTFLAETATIIGDVTIGKDCSIWYGAVLRGDVNTITIGDRTNIRMEPLSTPSTTSHPSPRRHTSETMYRWATTLRFTAHASATAF